MRVMAVLSGVLAAVPVVLLLCHAPAAAEDVAENSTHCLGLPSIRRAVDIFNYTLCDVIVGDLSLREIDLLEYCSGAGGCTDIEFLFPNLREVTGYVAIRSVRFPPHWSRLSYVFPNLRIIHGVSRLQYFDINGAFIPRVQGAILFIEGTNLMDVEIQDLCISVNSFDVELLTSESEEDEEDIYNPAVIRANPLICSNAYSTANPNNNIGLRISLQTIEIYVDTVRETDPRFLQTGNCLTIGRFAAISNFNDASRTGIPFLPPSVFSRSCPDLTIGGNGSMIPGRRATQITREGRESPCVYPCLQSPVNIMNWRDNYGVPCLRECGDSQITSVNSICQAIGCRIVTGDLLLSIPYLPEDSQPTTNCDLRLSGFDAYVTSAFSDVFSVGQDLIITELNCVSTFNFLMGIVSIKRNLIIRNNRLLRTFGRGNRTIHVGGDVIIMDNPLLCLGEINRFIRRRINFTDGGRRRVERNGFQGSCIDCLTFRRNASEPGVFNVVVYDDNCSSQFASHYPDLVGVNLSTLVYTGYLRQLEPEQENCIGMQNWDEFTTVINTELEYLQCANEERGWYTYSFMNNSDFVADLGLKQDVKPCVCTALGIRSTSRNMMTGEVLRLHRSAISTFLPELDAVPSILREVLVSSRLDRGVGYPSQTSASLTFSWLSSVSCNISSSTYGVQFRVASSMRTTADLRPLPNVTQCVENLNATWPAVFCNSRLPPGVSFSPPNHDFQVHMYRLPSEERPLASSYTISNLATGSQFYVQTRVILREMYGDWHLINPNITWTPPSSREFRTARITTDHNFDRNASSDTTSAISWTQDPLVLGRNLSAVHSYRLTFRENRTGSSQPRPPNMVAANLRLCREMRSRLRSSGCYTCSQLDDDRDDDSNSVDDIDNTCSEGLSFSCYIQCPETSNASSTCSLRNLTVAWCSIVFHDLEIQSCDGTGNCTEFGQRFTGFNRAQLCGLDSSNLFLRSCTEHFRPDFEIGLRNLCKPRSRNILVIAIPVAIVFSAVVLSLVCVRLRRLRKKTEDLKQKVMKLEILAGTDYTLVDYSPDEWEIDEDQLEIQEVLGEGAFGVVCKGVLTSQDDNGLAGSSLVAVKTLKVEGAYEKNMFLQEASVMKKFESPFIVRLKGIVSRGSPKVAMEYMANGDLKNYLRAVRKGQKPSAFCAGNALGGAAGVDSLEFGSDSGIPSTNGTIAQPSGASLTRGHISLPSEELFLQWATQLASGLQHLVEKRFVHRDVSARNCMLSDDLTLKISDFGLSRDIYQSDYYRKQGRGALPLRWLPPEALRDGVYSSATDVWSYGIVLYEMATLAELPYRGKSNEDVMEMILHGGRLEAPLVLHPFPSILLDIMSVCWTFDAGQRPTMEDLLGAIETGIVPLTEDAEEQPFPDESGDGMDMELPEEDTDGSVIGDVYHLDLPEEDLDGSLSDGSLQGAFARSGQLIFGPDGNPREVPTLSSVEHDEGSGDFPYDDWNPPRDQTDAPNPNTNSLSSKDLPLQPAPTLANRSQLALQRTLASSGPIPIDENGAEDLDRAEC